MARRGGQVRARPGLSGRSVLDRRPAAAGRRGHPRVHLRRLGHGCHRCARASIGSAAAELVARVRAVTDKPVAVGLGRVQRVPRLPRSPATPTGSSWVPHSFARCSTRRPRPRASRAVRDPGRRAGRRGAEPMMMITASIPSPSEGVVHLGPLPLRGYALCIADRRHRRRACSPSAGCGPAARRPDVASDIATAGGPVRHHRRPALPRDHHARPVLRQGRPPDRGALHLARRPRASGARIAGGFLGAWLRPAAPRDADQHRRRRVRPGPGGRAGHRPLGQLVQPGALRPADRRCPGRCTSTRRTG